MVSVNNFIFSLGLMSGTSMDGIDVAIIKSNGINLEEILGHYHSKYSKATTKMLFDAFYNISNFLKDENAQKELSYKVTIDHAKAADDLIKRMNIKPKVIGFHGQTIFHNAKKKITLQLGNGKLLSDLLKIDVVSDFRANDILYGGEGAPISPVYHQMLIEHYNLNLPTCILNIGGITNLTFFDGLELIGFDVGPGNGLMDSYMKTKLGRDYDLNGYLSSKGRIQKKLIKEFINNEYFSRSYPKSLDRNDFRYIISLIEDKNLSKKDAMATLAELTVKAIDISIKKLPKLPKRVVIVGGGSKNIYLVSRIKAILDMNVKTSDEIGFSSLGVEAEMMAYLAIRRLYSYPITFPKTTGVKKPIIGGVINKFNKDNLYYKRLPSSLL